MNLQYGTFPFQIHIVSMYVPTGCFVSLIPMLVLPFDMNVDAPVSLT